MCGICGIIHKENNVDSDWLDIMLNYLYERGPENVGKFINHNIGIGHTRLSIIDLNERANQPFIDDSTMNVISFNGEIYNYLEIKKELATTGVKFKTTSDTEVILEAYQTWGIAKTLSKLDGMFAFSIYDQSRATISLARDRFGKKPLYYLLNNDSLFFSSDIRSIWATNKHILTIDWESLDYYFSELSVPQPKTIWKEIKQLEPAHYATFHLEDFRLVKENYWQLPMPNDVHHSPEDATKQVEKLLFKAIEKRLNADVPIGFFLSGGIDSGLIVGMASQISPKPLKTFTIAVDNAQFDESEDAHRVATKFKTEHHNIHISAEIAKNIEDLIGYVGEPFADSSLVPTFLISKAIKEQLTVAVSGDGGDELFGGYDDYGLAYRTDTFLKNVGSSTFRNPIILVDKLLSKISRNENVGSYQHYSELNGSERMSRKMGFSKSEKSFLYGVNHLISVNNFTVNYMEELWANEETKSLTDTLMRASMKTRLLNDYLVKIDRASMINSIEVRSPYLDKDLAEYAFSLNYQLKFSKTGNKNILRSLAHKYLGIQSSKKKKTGFSIPIQSWLRNELKLWRDELIDSLIARQMLDKKTILNILNEFDNFKDDHTHKIWALICLELWFQKFYD